MPEIYLPGADAPTPCDWTDLKRWDDTVRDGKAKSREEAAATEIQKPTKKSKPSPASDKE